MLGLDSGYTVKYTHLPSGEGEYLTVYLSPCPNTDTVSCCSLLRTIGWYLLAKFLELWYAVWNLLFASFMLISDNNLLGAPCSCLTAASWDLWAKRFQLFVEICYLAIICQTSLWLQSINIVQPKNTHWMSVSRNCILPVGQLLTPSCQTWHDCAPVAILNICWILHTHAKTYCDFCHDILSPHPPRRFDRRIS